MSGRSYEVDNRDVSTTWLQLEDGTYVEVYPMDLLINALENGCAEDTSEIEACIDRLKELLGQMS